MRAYSITSSANVRSWSGTIKFSCLAAFRLTMNSNLVDLCLAASLQLIF